MGVNYVKNLLSKSSNSGIVVEPRLKSRFEDGSGIVHTQNDITDFKTASPPFAKESTAVETPNIEAKNHGREHIKKTISKSPIINIKNIDESKTIHENDDKLVSVNNTIIEKNKNIVQPLQTSSIEGFRKEPNKHSIQDTETETKTFGLLNKPHETSIIKDSRFDFKNNKGGLDNSLNTTEQPSVKISIGRIEVKAIKQPQKKQVKQKAKPSLKLSLEDYIEKRK